MASLQHLRCGKAVANCTCTWSSAERCRTRTYVTDPITGKRRPRSRSFTAKGKRAAERRHNQIAAELEAEAEQAQEYGSSFAGLVDDWLTIKERDCSPTTLVAYRRHTKRIKAEFGSLPAERVTGQMIDSWYTELMDGGMSRANVQHVHRVLRAICTFGFQDRGLSRIATNNAHPPSHRSPEVRPPSTPAVMAILAGLPTDKEWARAVKLLVFTGLRRGEVVGLRWDLWHGDTLEIAHSVVAVPGKFEVRTPKGKRTREVRLSPAAIDVLEAQRRWLVSIGVLSPTQPTTCDLTVAELADGWLAEKGVECAPVTMRDYRSLVNKITARFGDRRASELTEAEVGEWYRKMAAGSAGLSDARLDGIHWALHSMLAWGFEHRGLPAVVVRRSRHLTATGSATPWVFPDLRADGAGLKPRRPGWVSMMWERHRGEFGADSVNLHALRHHYATFLLDGGVPLKTVQDLLGHADGATTVNIYGHGSDPGSEMALKRLGELGD